MVARTHRGFMIHKIHETVEDVLLCGISDGLRQLYTRAAWSYVELYDSVNVRIKRYHEILSEYINVHKCD